jgi:hypothetical protein
LEENSELGCEECEIFVLCDGDEHSEVSLEDAVFEVLDGVFGE